MAGERDTQRKRLYTAERVLTPLAKPLREVKDIERYIKKQLARKAITRRYPAATRPIKVKDGRGCRSAYAYGSTSIGIPLWARNEAIVLHEVAHIVVARHFRGKLYASHGWQFASVLLDLVRFVMGREAHDVLKASFKVHKVRYTAPRAKREYTPEQLEILRARLAAGREVKA